jgi:hypothetical protein
MGSPGGRMTEIDEKRLNEIRAQNGWRIVLECVGPWNVFIYNDDDCENLLAETGMLSLSGLMFALENFKDTNIWDHY